MALKRIDINVELDDGTVHELHIGNPSLCAWDRTRAKRQWPSEDVAPLLWMTFIAHHHMKALGLIDCTHEEFEQKRCVMVESAAKATEEPADEDPTQPAADPAS